jgi:hypothetical protein
MTALETLATLREELDEVRDLRLEDLTGLTKDERDMVGVEDDVEVEEEVLQDDGDEDEDEDSAGMNLQDSDAVAGAENEMEIAAEHLCIPIRPRAHHHDQGA